MSVADLAQAAAAYKASAVAAARGPGGSELQAVMGQLQERTALLSQVMAQVQWGNGRWEAICLGQNCPAQLMKSFCQAPARDASRLPPPHAPQAEANEAARQLEWEQMKRVAARDRQVRGGFHLCPCIAKLSQGPQS